MQTEEYNFKLLYQHQAQKELLINENFNVLDKLLNSYISSRSRSVPPLEPNEGQLYIIPANAAPPWNQHSDAITYFQGSWIFIPPKEGMIFWIADEKRLLLFSADKWQEAL